MRTELVDKIPVTRIAPIKDGIENALPSSRIGDDSTYWIGGATVHLDRGEVIVVGRLHERANALLLIQKYFIPADRQMVFRIRAQYLDQSVKNHGLN